MRILQNILALLAPMADTLGTPIGKGDPMRTVYVQPNRWSLDDDVNGVDMSDSTVRFVTPDGDVLRPIWMWTSAHGSAVIEDTYGRCWNAVPAGVVVIG